MLRNSGFRVELDLRKDLTPGNKFYYWELRGVPIRIEIGPRDLKNGVVTIVRRDTFKKQTSKLETLISYIQKISEKMSVDLKEKAYVWMKERIYRVNNLDEIKRLVKNRAGIVEVPWCGKDECGHELEDFVEARLLGIPEYKEEKIEEECLICGEQAINVARLAIAY